MPSLEELCIRPPLDILVHWIVERESVHLARLHNQPPPWTTDPIIADWRFCNVDRCDDRETQWIFQNVITKHADSRQSSGSTWP